MNIFTAIDVLEKNGIQTKLTTVNKDGKMKDALTIGTGSIVPTIYQENLDQIRDEAEMLRFADTVLASVPAYDVAHMFTREFFLQHVRSCLRPATDDEETLTYPAFGDLEEYFRVFMDPFNDDSYPTVVVQKAHLYGLGIDAAELRKAGRDNLRKVVQILPMAEVIAALMGMDVPSGDEELLYVATTKDKLHGASIMLLGDILTNFCKDHGLDSICIIPSSKHEILLVKGAMDRAEIDAMIREVNETQVAEQDRLSDHGYWFTVA